MHIVMSSEGFRVTEVNIFIISENEYKICHVFGFMRPLRTNVIKNAAIWIANKGENAVSILYNISSVANIWELLWNRVILFLSWTVVERANGIALIVVSPGSAWALVIASAMAMVPMHAHIL